MNIRDHIWNYPIYLVKSVKTTAPISFVFLFVPIFIFLIYVFAINVSSILANFSKSEMVEGTVGYVTNLNPIFLPYTQADRDLRRLTFMKLIEIDQNGNPQKSIAKSWSVSNGFRKYTVSIDDDIYWSDGEKLGVDDIIFTVNLAKELQKNQIQDSIGLYFDGVTIVKESTNTVSFVLDRKNLSFFETLASVYPVPKHVLQDVPAYRLRDNVFSQYPVVTGPYLVSEYSDDQITLGANGFYVNGTPAISKYVYSMFKSASEVEKAFRNGFLDVISNMSSADTGYISEYSSSTTKYRYQISNRKKIIFFNMRTTKLASSDLRKGISLLLDVDSLIDTANLDGTKSTGVYAATSWAYEKSVKGAYYDLKLADSYLKKAAYTKNGSYYTTNDGKILNIRLTYLDNENNNRIARILKEMLNTNGVILDLDPQSYEKMTKETIATRDYELLMYEIETTIDPDQFDLWHSTRIDYPNLNLSGYKSDRADLFLERGRNNESTKSRKETYSLFQRTIDLDTPAIFLYESKFNLVAKNKVSGISTQGIKFPEDRYVAVNEWSIK